MRNQPRDLPVRQIAPATELEMFMTTEDGIDSTSLPIQDGTYKSYFDNAHGKRVETEAIIAEAIRKQYPSLTLTITETRSCNLLAFAQAGHGSATPIDANNDHVEHLIYRVYEAPAQRTLQGSLVDTIRFGKYLFKWEHNGKLHEFIFYVVVGGYYPLITNMTYIIGADQQSNDELLLAAGTFAENIHNKVLIFDGGFWDLSSELYQSVQNASWDDVILEPEMKRAIKGEVNKFFDSREKYKKLKVPWKRGIIYHGVCGHALLLCFRCIPLNSPFLFLHSLPVTARRSPSKQPCTCSMPDLPPSQPSTSAPSPPSLVQSIP